MLRQSAAPGDSPSFVHGAATVELQIPADLRFRAVGRLVAGGLAARAGLDIDEIDDVRLAIETLLRQPPARDELHLSMTESRDALELTIGPFSSTVADPAALERVLVPLVDDFFVRKSESGEWFTIRVSRRPSGRESR
jgi:hypothetical protein